jgi:hypothetical protein
MIMPKERNRLVIGNWCSDEMRRSTFSQTSMQMLGGAINTAYSQPSTETYRIGRHKTGYSFQRLCPIPLMKPVLLILDFVFSENNTVTIS